MRVKVYRNLKHGRSAPPLYSILTNNRVFCRTNSLVLTSVVFEVNQRGRERVLLHKQKNVHAFAIGNWCEDLDVIKTFEFNEAITYNPYVAPYFYIVGDAHRKVTGAVAVRLDADGMTATGSFCL